MRQKGVPRVIDFENYVASQQLYSQPLTQQQQWSKLLTLL